MSYPQSTYTSVCRAATLRNTIRRIAVFDAVVGEWPMRVEHGFGPVWDAGSRVLVLGSVPSPKSREMRFYYGHPRNRFWPVMAAVFHDDRCLRECRDPDQIVGLRRDFALRHHMALWDVIESCDIDGASDASIRNAVPSPRVKSRRRRSAQVSLLLFLPRLPPRIRTSVKSRQAVMATSSMVTMALRSTSRRP